MFCIFHQSLAYPGFSMTYLETPKNYNYRCIGHWSSVYLCHAVCLWNDMYIKLLIVKMSGEYLYFSLSASLNIKTYLIYAYMLFSIFPIYFSSCLLQNELCGGLS